MAAAIDVYKSGYAPDRLTDASAEVAEEGAETAQVEETQGEDSDSISPWVVAGGLVLLAAAAVVIGWMLRRRSNAS